MGKYNPGDQVQLKSGGPIMTVKEIRDLSISGSNEYCCQWFAGNKLNEGYFLEESLKPSDKIIQKNK